MSVKLDLHPEARGMRQNAMLPMWRGRGEEWQFCVFKYEKDLLNRSTGEYTPLGKMRLSRVSAVSGVCI